MHSVARHPAPLHAEQCAGSAAHPATVSLAQWSLVVVLEQKPHEEGSPLHWVSIIQPPTSGMVGDEVWDGGDAMAGGQRTVFIYIRGGL